MLDKFYTNTNVSRNLINISKNYIKNFNSYIIIEPSAGNGSFSNYLQNNNLIAMDIEPENDNIIKQNFFDFIPNEDEKYIVIGNPPFGRISSKAFEFLDYSMTFADYVCFLLPRTFKRYSFNKKINPYFHILFQKDLPEGIFYPSSMKAKTVFQIWEKRPYKRIIPKLKDHTDDFIILNKKNIHQAEFAIRAYGGNCGTISFAVNELAPKSWHFIKSKERNRDEIISIMKEIDFSFSKDTVRQDSVGKQELIHYYNLKKEELCI